MKETICIFIIFFIFSIDFVMRWLVTKWLRWLLNRNLGSWYARTYKGDNLWIENDGLTYRWRWNLSIRYQSCIYSWRCWFFCFFFLTFGKYWKDSRGRQIDEIKIMIKIHITLCHRIMLIQRCHHPTAYVKSSLGSSLIFAPLHFSFRSFFSYSFCRIAFVCRWMRIIFSNVLFLMCCTYI